MKMKAGRPKSNMPLRDKRITLRFTKDELKSIDDYIKKNKIDSRSAWIRETILNEIKK